MLRSAVMWPYRPCRIAEGRPYSGQYIPSAWALTFGAPDQTATILAHFRRRLLTSGGMWAGHIMIIVYDFPSSLKGLKVICMMSAG